MKATCNGVTLAESFPATSLKREYASFSNTHTVCPSKGTAS